MALSIAVSHGMKSIPLIGYGVGTAWMSKGGRKEEGPLNGELVEAIKTALKCGYTHIDTAEMYGTEREVGIAVKECHIPRDELFVTAKVWNNIKNPLEAVKKSLERLQVDYVDLYLIHSPFFSEETHAVSRVEAWKMMEEVQRLGLAKSIGVSNYQISHLEEILESCEVKPSVNQIEFHPYLPQPDLVQFCKQQGIVVEAYGPLVSLSRKPGGPLDAVVEGISRSKGRSPGQVLLRWVVQQGMVALTTSGKADRQAELLGVLEFELSGAEVSAISEAGQLLRHRQYWTDNFAGL